MPQPRKSPSTATRLGRAARSGSVIGAVIRAGEREAPARWLPSVELVASAFGGSRPVMRQPLARLREEDFRLHDAIAEAGGDRYFLETRRVMRPRIDSCMRMMSRLAQRRTPARIVRIQMQHRAILDAIAARAMSEHIVSAQRHIFAGDAAAVAKRAR